MNTVRMENVTKSFGPHMAVADLALEVPRGAVYGLIGPNGSGKTTTMRMIMSIVYPDRGAIEVLGEPLRGPCTDRIGYLPEERGLYRKMRVAEVLEYFALMKGCRDARPRVRAWLERLGLEGWANKKVEALSKGMAQKVQFIAAVVFQPELLVLDEPMAGLDPVNADLVRDAILELRREGVTTILSTHDMGVAERMCDFICMIFRGRKVLDGTLRSIQDRYGADRIRIRVEGSAALLEGVRGVAGVTDHGNAQELRLTGQRDPQEILAEIMARARVCAFEIARPSLHEIFVDIAGPQAQGGQP